jgi:hypothetical protein
MEELEDYSAVREAILREHPELREMIRRRQLVTAQGTSDSRDGRNTPRPPSPQQ